jgi:DNA-binding MarR family transcriptional regulator
MTATSARSSRGLFGSTGFLLGKAAQIVVGAFEEALKPYGLRSREFGVLALIHQEGPQSQHRLGELLRIDRTTMVTVIDELEQRGLVQRTRDPADRRRYAITLTPEGDKLMAGDLGRLDQRVNAAFLRPLSAAERRQLVELLRRLVGEARA